MLLSNSGWLPLTAKSPLASRMWRHISRLSRKLRRLAVDRDMFRRRRTACETTQSARQSIAIKPLTSP